MYDICIYIYTYNMYIYIYIHIIIYIYNGWWVCRELWWFYKSWSVCVSWHLGTLKYPLSPLVSSPLIPIWFSLPSQVHTPIWMQVDIPHSANPEDIPTVAGQYPHFYVANPMPFMPSPISPEMAGIDTLQNLEVYCLAYNINPAHLILIY